MAHKYILDAHPLVWNLEANPRLSTMAKAVIDNTDSQLVLPLIALAEAAFIIERGRTSIPAVSDLLMSVEADPRIDIYPITWEVFQRSLAAVIIPELHDRLIVGTALQLQRLGHTVSVVTKVLAFTHSGLVPIVWQIILYCQINFSAHPSSISSSNRSSSRPK
jgi:PIN domain nuclease of toxin-antitoxin system